MSKGESPEPSLTIADGYKAANEYFDKASEITRQLGLAGLAIIWVFKTDTGGRQIVPTDLFLPGLLIVAGLTLDLFQYVVSGEIWLRMTRNKERARTSTFRVPPWVNYFGTFFYWTKIIAIGAAYILLIRFLLQHIF